MSECEYYKAGMLLVGKAITDDQYNALLDSDDDLINVLSPWQVEPFVGQTVAWLPHSCNEWVIGGPEQIRALISDLQAALAAKEKK